MSVTWKRHPAKYSDGTHCWHLLVNDCRVGCVVAVWLTDGVKYQVIFRGKHQPKFYQSMSGARLRLEQLAAVQTPWAQSVRAKWPAPLTPEQQMWAILSQ
jgi:hypothetical protein